MLAAIAGKWLYFLYIFERPHHGRQDRDRDPVQGRLLKLIDAMIASGEPVIVTRHGKPVARLVPVEADSPQPSLFGSMKGTIHYADDLIEPAAALSDWEALR